MVCVWTVLNLLLNGSSCPGWVRSSPVWWWPQTPLWWLWPYFRQLDLITTRCTLLNLLQKEEWSNNTIKSFTALHLLTQHNVEIKSGWNQAVITPIHKTNSVLTEYTNKHLQCQQQIHYTFGLPRWRHQQKIRISILSLSKVMFTIYTYCQWNKLKNFKGGKVVSK